MKLQKISTRRHFSIAYKLIRELRPHLEEETFLSLSREARIRDDYKLVGMFANDECIALIGYRVLYDFVHGKHLYIDDLLVTEKRRSEGLGKKLLTFAETEARRIDCKILRICTGVENKRGMSFYQKNNWEQKAVVFKKKLAD